MDVKKLRERHGLTQSQLAVICGVTLRTVQNWEKGKVIPESMVKLLEKIDGNETSSVVNAYTNKENNSNEAAGGVATGGVAAGRDVVLSNTERFFSTIEKQQEIITSALEIVANQTQKKDEQIDELIQIIKEGMRQQKGQD